MEFHIVLFAVNYCSKSGTGCIYHDVPQLSSHQLEIIDKVITVLQQPVEDITKSISSEKASVSVIIPFVRVLRRSWENCSNDRGVQTMKNEE